MWLPDSVYSHAPHYWLFVGLAMMTISAYLGFVVGNSLMLIGVPLGAGCCIWGGRILVRRQNLAAAEKQDTE